MKTSSSSQRSGMTAASSGAVGPSPCGYCSVAATGIPKSLAGADQPDRAGDDLIAVVHRGQELVLDIDDQEGRGHAPWSIFASTTCSTPSIGRPYPAVSFPLADLGPDAKGDVRPLSSAPRTASTRATSGLSRRPFRQRRHMLNQTASFPGRDGRRLVFEGSACRKGSRIWGVRYPVSIPTRWRQNGGLGRRVSRPGGGDSCGGEASTPGDRTRRHGRPAGA